MNIRSSYNTFHNRKSKQILKSFFIYKTIKAIPTCTYTLVGKNPVPRRPVWDLRPGTCIQALEPRAGNAPSPWVGYQQITRSWSASEPPTSHKAAERGTQAIIS